MLFRAASACGDQVDWVGGFADSHGQHDPRAPVVVAVGRWASAFPQVAAPTLRPVSP